LSYEGRTDTLPVPFNTDGASDFSSLLDLILDDDDQMAELDLERIDVYEPTSCPVDIDAHRWALFVRCDRDDLTKSRVDDAHVYVFATESGEILHDLRLGRAYGPPTPGS